MSNEARREAERRYGPVRATAGAFDFTEIKTHAFVGGAEWQLDQIADIALGIDYANDHARVQALVLLFGEDYDE